MTSDAVEKLTATAIKPMDRDRSVLVVHFNRGMSSLEMNALHHHINAFPGLRPMRPVVDPGEGPYRIERDDSRESCVHCEAGAFWTILSGTGDAEIGIGTSWGDKELARDICDLMNMAASVAEEKSANAVT